MTDKEALLEALEALHYCEALNRDVDERKMQAITAIRKLWTEHAMQEVQRLGQEIEQEPVAYPDGDVVGPCICGSWPGGKCLKCPRITTPPQRKPLTDEQIDKLLGPLPRYADEWSMTDFIRFARAIEAAHGIKENT